MARHDWVFVLASLQSIGVFDVAQIRNSPVIYPILNTRSSVRQSSSVRNAHGTPPWILKLGELKSSGQTLISLISKTKRIAAFFLNRQKKTF